MSGKASCWFPLSSPTKPLAITQATERQIITQKVQGGLTLTLKLWAGILGCFSSIKQICGNDD